MRPVPIVTPRCKTVNEFNENHIEVYTAREEGRPGSPWEVQYAVWVHQSGRSVVYSAGEFLPYAKEVAGEAQIDGANTLTVTQAEGNTVRLYLAG